MSRSRRVAWIALFATGVLAAAQTTHQRVDGLLAWQESALDRVSRSCERARSPTGSPTRQR
jgi:hypothetical protein